MRRLVIIPVVVAVLVVFGSLVLYAVWALNQMGGPRSAGERGSAEAQRVDAEVDQGDSRPEPTVEGPHPPRELDIGPLDTNEAKLELFRHVTPGVTYETLKRSLPELSELRADAGRDLTEAFLDVEIFGFDAQVEFNFNNRVMYNFFYNFNTGKDREAAEELLESLRSYFTARYGAPEDESYQEENHYRVEKHVWRTEGVVASVTRNISSGSDYIVVKTEAR